MITKIKTSKNKVLAVLLSIAILCGVMPVAIGASGVSSFQVTLSDGVSALDLDDVSVTMTNKEDEQDTLTVTTVDGVAVFEDFAVIGKTYSVSAADVFGYEHAEPVEVTVEDDVLEATITLTALETKTVKGAVKDEEGNACADVTVSYTVEEIVNTVVTDENGEYSFEAVVGKSYSISVVGEQYEEAKIDIENISEDLECEELILKVKTFTVSTAITDGTVTPDSLVVKYGENVTLTIKANEGYRIGSVKAGETQYDDAKDLKEYELTLEAVKEDVSVEVSTYRKTYSVNVSYSGEGNVYEAEFDENGEIADVTESSKVVTDGGVIGFNEGDNAGFVAAATTGYHISKIVIDGVELKDEPYGNDFTKFEYKFDQDKDWTVAVEFLINIYNVDVEAGFNGSIRIEDDTVSHNGNTALITVKAHEGYDVESILIKSETNPDGVAPDEANIDAYGFAYTEDEAYTFVIPNVTEDITVEASFKKFAETKAEWKETLDITAEEGSFVEEKTDSDGNTVLVFSAGSVVKISPKDPYNRVKVRGVNSSLQGFATVSSSMEIKKFTVKKISLLPWENMSASSENNSKTIKIIIDKTNPALDDIEQMDEWSKLESYTISGKAYDVAGSKDMGEVSGVSHIVWSRGKALAAKDIIGASDKQKVEVSEDGTYSFTVTGEHNNEKYYIYAVDKAGNVSEVKTVEIKIDLTDPEVVSFNFNKLQKSTAEDLINFFTFGTLFKETIEVEIGFADKNVSSGVRKITLYSISNAETPEQKEVASLVLDKDGKVVEEESANATLFGGKAIFQLAEEEFNNMKVAAVVEDWSGRVSEIKMPTEVETNAESDNVIINSTEPIINITVPEADYTETVETENEEEPVSKLWYNNDVEFDVEISAESFVGINSVIVTLNGKELESDISEIPQAVNKNYAELVADENGVESNTLTEKLSFKFSTTQYAPEGEELAELTASGEYVLEVKAKTNTSVETVKTAVVYIDRTNPDVVNFDIKPVNISTVGTVVNFLSFGMFANGKLEVAVTPSDENASSGVAFITLFADEEELDVAPVEDGVAKFEVPLEEVADNTLAFNKTISAKATDNVGNVTESLVMPTTTNSDIIKSDFLMIETVMPTVAVTSRAADHVDDQGKSWYKEDIKFTVKVADADSGISSIRIFLNDKEILSDLNEKEISQEYYTLDEAIFEESFEIHTSQIDEAAADGSIALNVIVTDNAGNEHTETKVIYIDEKDPAIIEFDFAPDDDNAQYQEGVETEVSDVVEITEYGYYFKADTSVKITARDLTPSSGLKNISYYTVDVDGNESTIQIFPVENIREIAANGAEDGVENVTGNGGYEADYTVVIPANFKGQIYARSEDNVGNYPNEGGKAGFVTPDGAIVEDETEHAKETHVEFAKDNPVYSSTETGDLYAAAVPVTVTVIDTYSGIRSASWSVTAKYDTEKDKSGSVTVGNDGATLSGDEGWEIVEKDGNLVTKMQKTITVEHNSNDIVLSVSMEDRAGNKTENQTVKLSIDTTRPEITVVYDNNNPDPSNRDYYKADRTATITVKERNFDETGIASDILVSDNIDMTNTRDVQISAWTKVADENNPDNTTTVATVTYNGDGHYSFGFGYTDLAGNVSEDNNKYDTEFTIDKKAPVVNVGYDNNSALNGNYYRADRVATITINEHNFDASRVVITGTATDGDAYVEFPVESEWTKSATNPDLNLATIRYSSDAVYEFDIAFADMAGNNADDFAAQTFVVDKTAPALEITGVENFSANADKVAPVITYSDTNFNANGVTITLSGADNGSVDNYAAQYTDLENGQVYAFADFERVQEVDDIYTLSASVTDLAGNTSTQTIRFSANRFGSVYTLDDSLKNIRDQYVDTERDIVFTETNVDALSRDTIKVKLIKNGVATELVLGESLENGDDYIIVPDGGNGSWSQYQYVINKDLFASDGRYNISVYSVDAAGNVNQNTDETKKAEISFGIDKTSPVIVPADLESGKQYNVANKEVSIEIKDNLVLESVNIYLDGVKVEYTTDGDIYSFNIPENSEKQSVRIVAVDAAGNEHEVVAEDFIVSTNIFVRWYNNTPLFIGTVAGAAGLVLLAAIILLIIAKKKRDEDED